MRHLLVLLALLPLAIQAQEPRKTGATTYSLAAGHAALLDTYLSQEHYCGTDWRLAVQLDRGREGRKWGRMAWHQLEFATTTPRSGYRRMLTGSYTFQYAWLRSWTLLGGRLLLRAGGGAEASVGFAYNDHGGNNPAQARLALNLTPVVAASYQFRLFGRQLRADYLLTAPLAGLRFSPHGYQSYYEMFVKADYDRNVVPTTFVSAPSLRHTLTVDVPIGRGGAVRVGYLGDCQQTDANALKTHQYTHAALVGFVKSL